jgi:hypothetical protein
MTTGPVRATFDDVNLILRLYELRRDERLREARQWFATSFKPTTYEELQAMCPPGSEQNASYRMVTSYWEMVSSFLTSGVLNETLFFQSGRELLFCWERVRDIAPAVREANGNPNEWKNLETAAGRFISWWNAQSPGAYEKFGKRVRG